MENFAYPMSDLSSYKNKPWEKVLGVNTRKTSEAMGNEKERKQKKSQ